MFSVVIKIEYSKQNLYIYIYIYMCVCVCVCVCVYVFMDNIKVWVSCKMQ